MKKALILPGIAILGILLSGCGTSASAGNADAEVTTEDRSVSTEAASISTESSETTEFPYEEVVKSLSGISIITKEEHQAFTADDNTTCILDAAASYPVVEIKDNPEAANLINEAIMAELDSFWKFENANVTYAKEDYNASTENEDNTFDPYTANFTYSLKRCDERIISFVISLYDYTGGAHGNPWSYGITFDVANGNRLRLAALSNSSTEFYNMVLENVKSQSALPAYTDYVFDDFAPEIENSLLKGSNVWYLDNSGITFISNPYVLGSYAAGTFEFNIAYEDMTDFKNEYLYQGNYVRKLFPGISASHDLNGDGTPEDICYTAPSYTGDESGSELALTINGSDFSKQIKSLHMKYPLTGAYYLTDIDPDDGYVEIAIMDDDYEKGSCTHFFRYTIENTMVYIGNVKGLYTKGLDVRYNSNGNLVLFDADENQ